MRGMIISGYHRKNRSKLSFNKRFDGELTYFRKDIPVRPTGTCTQQKQRVCNLSIYLIVATAGWLILLCGFSPVMAETGGNLITNGGFEEGKEFPVSWDRLNGKSHGVTMIRTTRVSRTGKACAEITVPPEGWYIFRQKIEPVIKGKTYVASTWIKTRHVHGTKAGAYLTLTAWYDSKRSSVRSQFTVGSKDWKKVSTSKLTVPSGTKFLTVELLLFSKGSAWFDDVDVRRVKKVTVKEATRKEFVLAHRDGIYRFNFVSGEKIFADELAPNFIPVPPTVSYSQKQGYGWPGAATELVGISSRQPHHSLWHDLVGIKAKPGKFHPAVFQADLPNGNYELGIITGGYCRGYIPYLPFNVFVGERKILSRIHHSGFRTHFIPVEVTGGKLSIRFVNDVPAARLTDGLGRVSHRDIPFLAWRVCALTITPSLKRSVVRKELAGFDKKAKQYILGGRAILPLPKTAPCPPLEQKWKEAGYVAFVHQSELILYSNSRPSVAELKNPAHIQAARGEFEPITFGLHALKNMKDVSVSVSDLAGPSGTKIPATAFDIRLARNMLIRTEKCSNTCRRTPSILDPFKPFSVKAGRTRWVWLTVKVLSSQPAGKYAGKVRFAAVNAKAVELPLTVEVLPFELPKNNIPTGMYWHLGTIEYPENMEKQFQDMVDHGMTTIMYYTGPSVYYEIQGDKVVLDTKHFDKMMTAFMKVFPKSAVFTWRSNSLDWHIPSGNKKLEAAYKDMIAKLLEHCRKKGYPRPLFGPLDEPHAHEEMLERFQRLAGLIKQVPGAEVEVTLIPRAANTLKNCVDWRFYGGMPTFQKMLDTYDDGDKLCMYNMNRSQRTALGDRFAFGLTAWRVKPAAIGLWAYQWPMEDAFNDLDGFSRDWCYTYPHKTGPLPTVEWEAIREGVDDLKYLTLLERLADTARKSNDSKRQAAAGRADELMRCIRELNDPKKLESHPAMFRRIRKSVIKQILLLMEKSK